MNSEDLSALVESRFQTLTWLLELSQRQTQAIDENHMTDLMRILSDKQPAIAKLTEIARVMSTALDDDPTSRQWPSEAARQHCREQQNRCEQLHLELLAIEADCETKLSACRASVQEQLHRFDAGRSAADRYAQSRAHQPSGGKLDLSSD